MPPSPTSSLLAFPRPTFGEESNSNPALPSRSPLSVDCGPRFISDMGDWLLFIALPLVVFQLTGSALGTSIAFLLELVPAVLLAPLAARLIGRFDRRWLMVAVNVGQAVALLPLLWVDEVADLPIAYAVIFAHASLSTLFEPAKNTLLPELVHTERLVSANALIGLNQNLGRLIGGPLGGIPLVARRSRPDRRRSMRSPTSSPLRSSRRCPRWPGALGRAARTELGLSRDLGGAALSGCSLPCASRACAAHMRSSWSRASARACSWCSSSSSRSVRSQGSDADVGLLRGIQAIGAIVAGVVLGFIARGSSPRALTAASLLAFGALSLVTWNLPAVTTDIWPYVLLFAAVGAPGVIMVAGLMSVLQEQSEPRQRGAVFAAGAFRSPRAGPGSSSARCPTGPSGCCPLLEVQGCLYLLSGAIAMVWLPRAVDRPTSRAESATDAVSRTP